MREEPYVKVTNRRDRVVVVDTADAGVVIWKLQKIRV